MSKYEGWSDRAIELFKDTNLIIGDDETFTFQCPECDYTGDATKRGAGSVNKILCPSCDNILDDGKERKFVKEHFGSGYVYRVSRASASGLDPEAVHEHAIPVSANPDP